MNDLHNKNEPYISYNTSNHPTLKQYIQEIYSKRGLLSNIVHKDWILKMKSTYLGFGWLILQPLINILLYALIFGGIINITIENSNYILFLMSGLIIWNYFSQNTNMGGNALIQNQNLIRKTSFPKIILNISSAINTFLEQLPLFIIFIILVIYYQKPSFVQLTMLPISYCSIILFSTGISNILSLLALNKRDIMLAYPFIMQMIMWLTPIFYPVTLVPQKYEYLLYLNPLTGIVEILRWSVNINEHIHPLAIYSLIISVVFFCISIMIYKNRENNIADII